MWKDFIRISGSNCKRIVVLRDLQVVLRDLQVSGSEAEKDTDEIWN